MSARPKKVVFVAAIGSTLSHFVEPLAEEAAKCGWETVGCAAGASSSPGFHRTYDLPPYRRGGILAHVRSFRALSRIVREERPNVIHMHTPSALILGRLVAARYRVPAVAVVHGTFLDDRTWRRLAFIAAEFVTARLASLTVTVNDADQAFYARLCRAGSVVKAPVGGMGLDPRIGMLSGGSASAESEGRRSAGRPPSLLYLGRLAGDKNLDQLVRAWRQAKLEIADLRLRLVGAPIAGDPVWVVPELEGVDVLAWTEDPFDQERNATVAVATSRREGFPMFVAESLVCGTPVVAVANSGTHTIAQDSGNGIRLVADDADQIAGAIVQVIKEAPPRDFRSDLARRWGRESACSFHLSLLERFS